MARSSVAATLLLGAVVLAVAADELAADELARNKPGVVQVASEQSVPGVESPPATEDMSSPDAARPAAPARVVQPPPSDGAVREQAGSKSAVPLRDPTQAGEQLRDVVAPIRMGQQAGKGGPAGIGLPQVTLKGRVIGPLKPPAAIVEVDGVLYVLQQGSELTVPAPNVGLGSLSLKVSELTASEVRIEIMPLRRAIVLR